MISHALKASFAILLAFSGIAVNEEAQAQVQTDYCNDADIEDTAEVVDNNQVFITVHGLGSKPTTWGVSDDKDNYEGTIRQLVDTFANTHYFAFDYSEYNGRWVTNHNIGPKLADTIECFMQLSREGGGTGKIILLAHSMGGLAAQVALDEIESPENVDVVSFGTPYEGSHYANAFAPLFDGVCTGRYVLGTFFDEMAPDDFNCLGENNALNGLSAGSAELAALPDFPPETSVQAIAGNVTRKFFGMKAELNGDLVVPVYSATAYYTNHGDGDGVSEIGCEGFFVNVPNMTDAPCSHVRMLKDPNVQEAARQAIQAFIEASIPDPECVTGKDTAMALSEYYNPGGPLTEEYWAELSEAERGELSGYAIFCDKDWAAAQMFDRGGDHFIILHHSGEAWAVYGAYNLESWEDTSPNICDEVPWEVYDWVNQEYQTAEETDVNPDVREVAC